MDMYKEMYMNDTKENSYQQPTDTEQVEAIIIQTNQQRSDCIEKHSKTRRAKQARSCPISSLVADATFFAISPKGVFYCVKAEPGPSGSLSRTCDNIYIYIYSIYV